MNKVILIVRNKKSGRLYTSVHGNRAQANSYFAQLTSDYERHMTIIGRILY